MSMSPVIFADGTDFFKGLGRSFKTHSKGLFIWGPSGSGKTHFCTNQNDPDWLDGDTVLWYAGHAHPIGPWWTESLDVMNRVDMRSDMLTMEAMEQGFWIMGASSYWLPPSALVIPDWETHKGQIKYREEHDYDGGAKSSDHAQVLGHIEAMKQRWHVEKGVPIFTTIEEAVAELTRGL